jgi:opacity protein-like surface antigen
MKRILAPAMALVGLSALSGMAYGQAVVLTSNSYSWGGFYAGVNAGGVFNRTCANWTPYVNGVPVSDYVLNNCPNNSEFTGGAQLGYNFAFDQIVLGLEADYNGWSSKSKTSTPARFFRPERTPSPGRRARTAVARCVCALATR